MMAEITNEKRENDQYLYKKEASGTMNPERFLEGLTDEERKLYETCLSLLQSIGEDGNLEEVCDWLEKKVEKNRKST